MDILLTSLQDFIDNEEAYVELGLHCAEICTAIDRGMNGKRLGDLSQSVCEAINQLTAYVQLDMYGLGIHRLRVDRRTVAKIQGKATKHSGRGRVSRLVHSKNDKEKIAAWKLELDRILQVFNVRRAPLACQPQLTAPLSDGVGREHPRDGFRHARRYVEDPGGG
jgi:hypothetical protein